MFLINLGLSCFPPAKMILSLRAKSPSTYQDSAATSVAPDSQLPIAPLSACQTLFQMASQGPREKSQTPQLGIPSVPHLVPTCFSSHPHCFCTLGANQICLVFLLHLPMFNFTCPYFHHTPLLRGSSTVPSLGNCCSMKSSEKQRYCPLIDWHYASPIVWDVSESPGMELRTW